MKSESFWLKLPVDVKVEIFARMLSANKLISLVDQKNLISLKIICKDWNFVISRFCVPQLCPPNPCAQVQGFLYSVEDEPDEVDDDYSEESDKIKWKAFMMSLFGKDSYHENSVEFRSNTQSFLKAERIRALVEPKIWSLIPSQDVEIRDCCNGLILFASSNSQYYVGNPITRQRFPVNPNTRGTTRSSLVFDPSLFLGENQDPYFKIVSFKEATVSDLMEVDIYSSDKGEWCTSVVHIFEPHRIYGRLVYFNRALYSLSGAMYLVCIENVITTSPDLRAWAIALPDKDEKPSQIGCIGNCSGGFYYSNLNVHESFISVWMLGNSEWRLMHRISISEDIGHCTGLTLPLKKFREWKMEQYKESKVFRPHVILPNDDNGMTLYIGFSKNFLSYNVETKITETLPVRKRLKSDGNMFFPFSPCPLLFTLK